MFPPSSLAIAGVLALFASTLVAELPPPIAATDPAGRPLNLGFEDGTLRDWAATGNAFDKQPVKGDRVAARRGDMRSRHAGHFWIGGFETGLGDDPTGTLTSAPFKVTQPWASFLVAGGDWPGTRVEIVTKDDGKVIQTARGAQREDLAPVTVDLRKFQGREIFIRIVDEQKGHWGHVNFDDFVFHGSQPSAAAPVAAPVAAKAPAAPADDVKFAGLTPDEAAKAASVPPGFELKLFAAEPDVVNPIAFCLDDRARLWVVEGRTYPTRAKEGEGQDRILVFEDRNGDGRFDRRTVFMERLNLVSGIAYGFGGIWIGAAPHLLFVPVTEGDEPKPAGEPRVLLDGWGFQDTHETLNTFVWGPDGWLYGCHGVFTHSNVGTPGSPESARQKINAGFWRYHPRRHVFEVFAHGTSNSWGIDFDVHGQLFAEACVIPHLFHVVQGGRYQRQAGQHFGTHTYDDIKTIADHRHYSGQTPHAGNNRSDSAGGGHAHAGLMIYQGKSWPAEFQGKIFIGNIHGQRINVDVPVSKGSGFVGKHAPDFVNFNDRWSQVVNLLTDQDGSAYFIDWYDKQQCHVPKPEVHDRSSGRIFKLIYRGQPATPVNLAAKSDADLAALVTDPSEWHSRHARRLLQERAPKAPWPELVKTVREKGPREALRALWTLHVTQQLEEELLIECLARDDSPYLSAWAVQLACEEKPPGPNVRAQLAALASAAKSPIVRLYLASALQRLPVEERLPILEPMIAREEDAGDHNLPLMHWYALEPLVAKNPAVGAALLPKAKIPLLQEYIARRMASTAER